MTILTHIFKKRLPGLPQICGARASKRVVANLVKLTCMEAPMELSNGPHCFAFLSKRWSRESRAKSRAQTRQEPPRSDQSHQQPDDPFRTAMRVRDVPSLESLVCCARWSFDPQGNLVGDTDAVAFQGYYLFWVVGQNTDVL